MKKIICMLFSILNIALLNAQNLPFTQIEKIPNAIGPSLSGFNGRHNVNIMNQRQGNEIFKPLYNEFLLSYDAGKSFKNNARIGWGLDYLYDTAGEAKLKKQSIGLKINYSILGYKKDSTSHRIAIGAGFNMIRRSISNKDLRWPSQIGSGGFNPNLPGERINSYIYPDMNIGLSYILSIKASKITIGLSNFQINKPAISSINGSNLKASPRIAYYGFADLKIGSNFSIKPQFYYTKEFNYNYLLYGNTFAFQPNSKILSYEIGGGLINNKLYANGGITIKDRYSINVSYYKIPNIFHQKVNFNFGIMI